MRGYYETPGVECQKSAEVLDAIRFRGYRVIDSIPCVTHCRSDGGPALTVRRADLKPETGGWQKIEKTRLRYDGVEYVFHRHDFVSGRVVFWPEYCGIPALRETTLGPIDPSVQTGQTTAQNGDALVKNAPDGANWPIGGDRPE